MITRRSPTIVNTSVIIVNNAKNTPTTTYITPSIVNSSIVNAPNGYYNSILNRFLFRRSIIWTYSQNSYISTIYPKCRRMREGEIRTSNSSPPQNPPLYPSNIPPGYFPSPAYYPPSGFRFETKTEKGLKLLNWGLWVNAMASILIIIVILFLISDGGNMLSMYTFVGIAGLMGFVFFILWILGLAIMYSGKYEYGPVHSQKVTMALIFFILAIIIYISGNIISMFFIFAYSPTPDFGANDFETSIVTMYTIQIITGFLTNIFTSLMWVFLIIELARQKIKSFIWTFFIISIAIYALASIFTVGWGIWDGFNLSFIGGLGIIGAVLLIYCYWDTYNRVKNRDIVPIIPPPMPPPFYPPSYPAYYNPQYEPKLKTGPYHQPPR